VTSAASLRRFRHNLRYLLPLVVLVVLLSGGGFAALETDTVSSFGSGVWWALSLVTTVGFVGETPTTTGGRVLAAFLMIFGFILLSLTTAAVASLFVREDEQATEAREAAADAEILTALRDIQARLDRLESNIRSVRTERHDLADEPVPGAERAVEPPRRRRSPE
jgi:voltage-gated potassium channel